MSLSDGLHDVGINEAAGHRRGDGQLSAISMHEVRSLVQNCVRVADSSAKLLDTLRNVQRLFESGDSHSRFSGCCTNEGANIKNFYVEILSSLTQLAALPLCEADSGELPAGSYAAVPEKASAICAVLLALSRRAGADCTAQCSHCSSSWSNTLWRALAPPLFVFAVTHIQDRPWTSDDSRTAASLLLSAVVQWGGFASCSQLLCGTSEEEHAGILAPALEILRPELTKGHWKRNQATKHIFSWMLMQVRRPWLFEFLDRVFPHSLLISDDYRTDNKVLGVCCLHHIVLNVPAADLRQYNRAQVLYHALFNHLYVSEAQVIEVVLPCLLDLLSVLEKSPGNAGAPRKLNRYDKVLQLVLTHMEMEHKLVLRRVYVKNVVLFVDRMGVLIVRHLKRLERVILGYLEVSDAPGEQARLGILEVLEKTIQHAWPRMECRMAVLVRALLKLLVDVAADSSVAPPTVREEVLSRATRCLQLLDYCSQGKLKVLLAEVDSSCADSTVLECLKKESMENIRKTWEKY